MCVVSMVYDYGRSLNNWDLLKYTEFQSLVQHAKKFDEKTGQPDCEDPNKTQWLTDLEIELGLK